MSIARLGEAIENPSVTQIMAAYPSKKAFDAAVQQGKIKPTTEAGVVANIYNRIVNEALAQQGQTETTVFQDNTQPAPQMGLAAAQQMQGQPAGAGVDQIPVPEQMFSAPQGMAGGGIVAFQGGGGARLDPRIPALMQRNPGMTFAQAARIIAGGAGLGAFSVGKMATDALMATDTGETGAPGYDYGAEQTAGGMPELQPGTTGARREPAGFMDYLRAAGLAPKEQVMDPVTGKYVDAPPKTLIETQSATPGLAGVMDREAALAEAQAKTTPLRQGETAVEDAKFARQNTGVPISSEGIGDKGITKGTGAAGTGTAKTTAGPKAAAGEAPKPFDPIAQLQDYERRLGISADPDKETRDELDAAAKKLGEDKDRNANMAILKAGLAMMGGESPYAFVNIAKGGMAGLEDYGKSEGERRKEEKELMKARADLRRADEARKQNRLKEAITLEQNYLTNTLNIRKTAAQELQAQAAMIQAQRGPAELQTYETWAAQQKAAGKPFDMESYRSSSPSVRAAEINLASKTVEALQKSFEPGGTYSSQYKAILKDKGPAAAESFKQGIILNGMATVSDYINRGSTPTTGRAGSGMPQLNIPPEIADLLKQYPTR